jgi:hypothetical protein
MIEPKAGEATQRLTDDVRRRIEQFADATGTAQPPIPQSTFLEVGLSVDARKRVETEAR